MAIQKEITTAQGVTTNYHRISEIHVRYGAATDIEICILSYTSEDYRNIEKKDNVCTVAGSSVIFVPMNDDDTYSRKNIYEAIMALPEWAGSTKV